MFQHNTRDQNKILFWILLDPLGEYEKEYLQAYARDSEDFMAKVKRWGDKHKRTGFRKIPRLEVNPTADHFKRVIDKRKASWDAYIVC